MQQRLKTLTGQQNRQEQAGDNEVICSKTTQQWSQCNICLVKDDSWIMPCLHDCWRSAAAPSWA
jgi:hypothetical protein